MKAKPSRKNDNLFILSYAFIVIIPNLLFLVAGFFGPLAFILFVVLSFYYAPMAALFGEPIFNKDTVIIPNGYVGVLLTIGIYSIPFFAGRVISNIKNKRG